MYCPYCSHHVWDRDPGTCPSCGKPLPAIFPDPEASPLASWPDFAALVKIACWAQADIAFGLDFRLFAVQTEWLDQSGDRGALLRLLDYHALGVDQSLDYLSLRRALEAPAKIADFMVDLMWCLCADVEEAAGAVKPLLWGALERQEISDRAYEARLKVFEPAHQAFLVQVDALRRSRLDEARTAKVHWRELPFASEAEPAFVALSALSDARSLLMEQTGEYAAALAARLLTKLRKTAQKAAAPRVKSFQARMEQMILGRWTGRMRRFCAQPQPGPARTAMAIEMSSCCLHRSLPAVYKKQIEPVWNDFVRAQDPAEAGQAPQPAQA
ncbi:MAG: hypothetical protein II132_10450 [Desulfovibrio sp.]|jgi:hypothetical protein|nr:hypothetical protein [Desulfovibrio sp.]MCR5170616.1 hypothetical protein [Desulfovibrio sp.]